LSKFYDEETLNSNYKNITPSKNEYSYRNNQETAKYSSQRKDIDKSENLDNPFGFEGISGGKILVDDSGIKVDKSPNEYKSLDDEVFKDMQHQFHGLFSLNDKPIA
jgi:hypothetical protein